MFCGRAIWTSLHALSLSRLRDSPLPEGAFLLDLCLEHLSVRIRVHLSSRRGSLLVYVAKTSSASFLGTFSHKRRLL